MKTIEKIASLDALEEALASSSERPLWLLKHSLTCPVSDAGLREFERFVETADEAARYTMIEIQRARPVSAEVESRLGVRHESPQALLIVEGEVRWHQSHWSITTGALQAASA